MPSVVPSPGISTLRPSTMRMNMRCSRSGMMLFGPKTIEKAAIEHGKPFSRCSRIRMSSHSSLFMPYVFWAGPRSTGWCSEMGNRSAGA